MVQKINPHPAPGCNRSPPYYVFSKDAKLGSVLSISSEVLAQSKYRRSPLSLIFGNWKTYEFSQKIQRPPADNFHRDNIAGLQVLCVSPDFETLQQL